MSNYGVSWRVPPPLKGPRHAPFDIEPTGPGWPRAAHGDLSGCPAAPLSALLGISGAGGAADHLSWRLAASLHALATQLRPLHSIALLPRMLHAVLLYSHVGRSDGYSPRIRSDPIQKLRLFIAGDTSPNATTVAVPASRSDTVDQVLAQCQPASVLRRWHAKTTGKAVQLTKPSNSASGGKR